jgi:hypothetical protein
MLATQTLTAAVVLPEAASPYPTLTAEEFITLDRREVEDRLGRKLKWRERLAFRSTQRQVKYRLENPDQDDYGQSNGYAIAGFVCAVVGIFIFGIILGTLGIVFSAIGLSRSNNRGYRGRGLAIAGLVCGIVAVVGALVVISTL